MSGRIGFAGLGAMGSGMVRRLLEQGFDVTVYNRTPAKAEALREQGAKVASTPAGLAADADLLMLSLADEDAVTGVLYGEDGAANALPPGTLIADLSTVSPGFARSLADRAEQTGHRTVDACVLGNQHHARTGELRFMVGGAAADFAELREILGALGKEVKHVGGSGSGSAMKLVLNLLMGVQMQALAEAVVLGVRAGLPRQAVIEAITQSGFSSPVMRFKAGVMAGRTFEPPGFRLSLMRKDLMLALAESHRLAVPLPVVDATYENLTAALQRGLGDLDCAAVLAHAEQISGVTDRPWPGPGDAQVARARDGSRDRAQDGAQDGAQDRARDDAVGAGSYPRGGGEA